MRELPEFSEARVLIVGDVMLDRYWQGQTSRISPEAPVPVVKVEGEEGRPGGAGNVALNVAELDGSVSLLGLVGDDEPANALQRVLQKAGVDCQFSVLPNFSTITKLRVMSRHQQLIRLDFEDDFSAVPMSPDFLARFEELLSAHDVVVFSDYGKGTLVELEAMIEAARKANKLVLVDPKGVDFSRYRGASLITPNLAEFEAVVGPCEDEEEILNKGRTLMSRFDIDNLLVTRGERGMTLIAQNGEFHHLPTQARDVFDVTGAGDTVIGTLAAGLSVGLPLEFATQLANLAAGLVVGKLGTASVSPQEMQQALAAQQAFDHGVVSESHLMSAIESARARGESIVMTNGCFDILHAGHVTYLEESARLGDRLVVAVNVDETVRALKGPDRPVNPVDNRMRVLAALSCVDWVVPFTEETPERLICAVQPDYLVKGGDNEPDKIPGAKCTRAAGGKVAVMSYIDGVSTTRIVESIRERG